MGGDRDGANGDGDVRAGVRGDVGGRKRGGKTMRCWVRTSVVLVGAKGGLGRCRGLI
jgi:hypothetical protein